MTSVGLAERHSIFAESADPEVTRDDDYDDDDADNVEDVHRVSLIRIEISLLLQRASGRRRGG
jgi:hypothetical protein